MPQTNTNEWERILDDQFKDTNWYKAVGVVLKEFISDLLSRHDKERTAEIIEMVEGMKVEHPSCYDGCPEDMDVECPISAKNQVIDDILTTLRHKTLMESAEKPPRATTIKGNYAVTAGGKIDVTHKSPEDITLTTLRPPEGGEETND